MSDPGMNYRSMLMNISREIKNRNVCLDMLKFTLADFVNTRTDLENTKTAFDLFMQLDIARHLSRDNLKILIATIELLGLHYLKDVILKFGFQYDGNIDMASVFTPFRLRVITIAKVLLPEQVQTIAGVHQVPEENFINQWKLLQYLQDNNVLNENKLTGFIETLRTNGVCVNIDVVDQPPVIALPAAAPCGNNQAIGDNHTVDEDKFKDLLTLVKQWYSAREHINLVKVLLKEILKDNYNVKLIKDFHEFFEKLYEAGKLHPTNLTILYELIKCTGQFGLEREIRKIVPLCPTIKDLEVVGISTFRIKLKNFGNALCQRDWDAIDTLYNMPRKGYTDSWSLIIDLEERGVISEDDLEKFINKLQESPLGLSHAAAVLR